MRKKLWVGLVVLALPALLMMSASRALAEPSDQGPVRIRKVKPEPPPPTIRVRLGDPSASELKGQPAWSNGFPTGDVFYVRNFDSRNGTVQFVHGSHTFTVGNVSQVYGASKKSLPEEGISSWHIDFDFPFQYALDSEIGRDWVMRFLASLRNSGWVRCREFFGEPRLFGRETWDYYIKTGGEAPISLDSTYFPTIEEWDAILHKRSPMWIFYADGAYLSVWINDVHTLVINIENEREHYSLDLQVYLRSDQEVHNWKALLPAALAEEIAERQKEEADLAAQGYHIDTSYQDPPIQALQPTVVPTPVSGSAK